MNKQVRNQRLEDAIKKYGIMKWEVADLLGISPQTLSVRLRREWDNEAIDEAIEKIRVYVEG